MALQIVQVATILCQAVVTIGKASYRLDVLLSFSPISLHDLLHATSDEFRS
jgi:sarcosine oxidase gamma subunit